MKAVNYIFAGFLLFAAGASAQSNGNLDKTKITVKFAAAPGTVTVTKAVLKYNKLFAFSAQLDDGGSDIYTNGFPFLNGGTVSGTTYPGLTYTDGCGHDIKFKMSSSLFSFDVSEKVDIHDPNTGYSSYITWPQACEMYKAGWGISNHGLSGNVGQYQYSVERNHSYVKLKTQAATSEGIRMGIFVNPNGDTAYTQYAFQNAYRVCYREGYNFGKPSFDVASNWTHGPLRMGRTQFITGTNLSTLADNMAAGSTGGKHQWGVVFSHSITNAQWGYDFATFKTQMTYLYSKYGKGGADNIWMTTEEEVLDYILLSPYLTVSTSKTGNDVVISFSGNLPTNFKFYAISLLVNGAANITSVAVAGPGVISYNGTGTKNSLINLTWDKTALLPDTIDPALKDAQTWVSKTEANPTQDNANVTMDYLNILPNGTARTALVKRLCKLTQLTFPAGFCLVGIDDETLGHFEIFPNPAGEDLNVKAQVVMDRITLVNVLGREVYSNVIDSKEAVINVSSIEAGIYMVRIDVKGKSLIRKIQIF